MPLFSIITAAYNCKEDLKLTMESLKAQNFRDFEHIIIDGASTDGTLDFLQKNKEDISYWVSEKDDGIYDAMNKGLRSAKGEYVHFLNAGDIFQADNSLESVAEHAGDLCNQIIYGEIIATDKKDVEVFHAKPIGFTLDIIKERGTACLNHQAMFVRRDVAPEYSKQYRLKGELNWYIDIVESNPDLKLHYVKKPIIRYKLGGASNVHYLENLKEWIFVVQRRFGTLQNIKNIKWYRGLIRYNKSIKPYFDS